jgi:alanyl-tRNA synthetase
MDFFKEKKHTIVPSSSLMPDAPNLLFTNAGMNQFVPIFLEEQKCPYSPPRAADTQKCIRAGGKHNDLEDVGLDTYHHTFFEMLGNWSFGDYFKREAIEWAWELIVDRWGFPPERLYATVYKPGKKDPATFDDEAAGVWTGIFKKAGLDPKVHVLTSGKKDNFWMMGDTGPCGPCSEIHIDLTPKGDSGGKLVNKDDPRCIEIWNLVFIQFNANADGTFSDLPSKHVDTGMGFERVCSVIQNTKKFKDFSGTISNYNTDIFQPFFDELEKLSGKKYTGSLPKGKNKKLKKAVATDIAMRVIADHIRALSLSIADGIMPGREGRNYVLRRILRRAVRYGRELDLHDLFFYKLVSVVADTLGDVFPEVRERQNDIERVIRAEEESFSRTLDNGIELFNGVAKSLSDKDVFPGDKAFELSDTYGFPIDLPELMARERGLKIDLEAFEACLAEQRERSKAGQKKTTIEVAGEDEELPATEFVGYDFKENVEVELQSAMVDPAPGPGGTHRGRLFFTPSPFYAEMGGQVGDTGVLHADEHLVRIIDTVKAGADSAAHITEDLDQLDSLAPGLVASVNLERRAWIEGHHSATHLLHWALREVLGKTVSQKGSYVGPDRLRFDFSHFEGMKPEEMEEVERLVNTHIESATPVRWNEAAYADVKNDSDIMQFFGDKYGDTVRVVDIGGFSKELCAGTHVANTSEIGPFRLISESAIAAGVRRIEAVAGTAITKYLAGVFEQQTQEAAQLAEKLPDYKPKIEGSVTDPADAWSRFVHNRAEIENLKAKIREWEKAQSKNKQALLQDEAIACVPDWIAKAKDLNGVPFIALDLGTCDPAFLQIAANALKNQWDGVAVFAARAGSRVQLLAMSGASHSGTVQAGALIREIAPLVGGKGGGRPEMAQGGGTEQGGIGEALNRAEAFVRDR